MAANPILTGLTPEQREAVLHREGPLLILAGAGSGKTRVVTRRIAHLVGQGVAPGSILAITFTNKAAGEMRERVATLLPGGSTPRRGGRGRTRERGDDRPTISTFHAFALRVLRQNSKRIGYEHGFSILDSGDQLSLVREAAVEAGVDIKKFRPQDLAHAMGRAKERLDDEGFARDATSDMARAAARALPGYRALQRERAAMDFEDLVAEAVLLLERDDEVREELNARIEYVLIDEYQDTNHSQYRLARLLAGPSQNLCVVGDPDQSIYGWRGADMGNILRFEGDFDGARVITLERNYRSTANILEASNALIAHNTVRREKVLRPTGETGVLIDVLPCLDDQQEADAVARRIKRAVDEGTSPAEVAIIFRAAIHARNYEDALLRHGVPCAMSGGTSFFDRQEVKDALAYLKLALNPKDDMAALRALRLSTNVGKRTVDKVLDLQRRERLSVVEACERSAEIVGLTPTKRDSVVGFSRLVRELGQAAGGPVETLVVTAITKAGLAGGDDGISDPRAEMRQANLRRLIDVARKTDGRARRGGGKGARGEVARQFLDRLALIDAQDKDEGTGERVTLTTVHSAKGLEFDLVFCVGLEKGLFPHWRALEEGGLEEERRLAYVAFTRARKRLVLTWANHRAARRAQDRKRTPSPFLYELPQALLWDPILREPMELPDPTAEPEPAARPKRKTKVKVELFGKQDDGQEKAPPLWSRGLISSRGA